MDVRMKLRDALLDLLFPRVRCMACGGGEKVRDGICAACRAEMERAPLLDACPVCGRASKAREICSKCRVQRPAYQAVRAVFLYEGAARTLIHRMKFDGEYDLTVRLFAKEMVRALDALEWTADCVVAVPSTCRTLRRRGYNQVEKLGRRLCRLNDMRFEGNVLKKKRGTRSQVGLSVQERKQNLSGAILTGSKSAKVAGKRVLLIDDVFTTGATAEACAQVLHACGAKEVRVLCAARVADHALENYLANKME